MISTQKRGKSEQNERLSGVTRLYGEPCKLPEIPMKHSCGHVQYRCYVNRKYWEENGLCSACARVFRNTPLSEKALQKCAELVTWIDGMPHALNDDGSLWQPPAMKVYPEFEALKRSWAEKKQRRKQKRTAHSAHAQNAPRDKRKRDASRTQATA